jgi:hypothetical protein
MRLYKNVTKTLLAVKTPRRLYIEPGMLIDVDALGDISRTDIDMFINRGVLVSVESSKKVKTDPAPKARSVTPISGKKPTTEVVVGENQTVVIRSTVDDEVQQDMKPELGRVHKLGSAAAVISAPPDDPVNMNPRQNAPFKGEAYNALPQNVKDSIAVVEGIAAGTAEGP